MDDARCRNYTVSICHQPWMQKHCPDMCRGHENSTIVPDTARTTAKPQSASTTVGASKFVLDIPNF